MKNFLCAVAFMLIASVGYSKTNEEKPVQKAKIVAKTLIEAKSQSPKLLPVRYTVKCRNGSSWTIICDGCSIGEIIDVASSLCS